MMSMDPFVAEILKTRLAVTDALQNQDRTHRADLDAMKVKYAADLDAMKAEFAEKLALELKHVYIDSNIACEKIRDDVGKLNTEIESIHSVCELTALDDYDRICKAFQIRDSQIAECETKIASNKRLFANLAYIVGAAVLGCTLMLGFVICV